MRGVVLVHQTSAPACISSLFSLERKYFITSLPACRKGTTVELSHLLAPHLVPSSFRVAIHEAQSQGQFWPQAKKLLEKFVGSSRMEDYIDAQQCRIALDKLR